MNANAELKAPTTRDIAKDTTRAKVLEAAKDMFEAEGYERATIRNIAFMARMSTGAVFASFSGKVELWQAIYGDPPISPEKALVLLAALKTLESLVASFGDLEHDPPMKRGLDKARAAVALVARPQ